MARNLLRVRIRVLDRFLLILLLVAVVISIGFGILIESRVSDRIRNNIIAQNNAHTSVLAKVVERELEVGNYRAVWSQLNQGVNEKSFLAFLLLDGEGRSLVSDRESAALFDNIRKENKWVSLDSHVNSKVQVTTNNLYSHIDQKVANLGAAKPFRILFLFDVSDALAPLRFVRVTLIGVTGIFVLALVIALYLVRAAFNSAFEQISSGVSAMLGNQKPKAISETLLNEYFPAKKLLKSVSDQYLQAQERLKETVRLKVFEQIASQVSHDIRSPLSVLRFAVRSIKGVTEDERELIDVATKRIDNIANELLEQTKQLHIGGAPSIEKTEVVPSASLRLCALCKIIERSVREKQVEFRCYGTVNLITDFPKGLVSAYIDQYALERVLSNLLNNSAEATKHNGTIKVSLRSYRDQVAIVITDNGCGIPPERLDKVGQRGISFWSTSQHRSGTGLGLYHAKQVLESMRGELRIQSREGSGTIVTLLLPKPRVAETPLDLEQAQ